MARTSGSFSRTTPSTAYGGSQRSQDASDDYWKKLFSGTDYEDLYNSIVNSYGVAPPKTFWGMLTGQNATNAYQHEMSKRDELSALAEKMYNEEYSSYENQAQMMREAGLNPDLLGVSGGASSEMSPDGVNPNIRSENGLGVIGSLASLCMTAVGAASSAVGLVGAGLSLDSQRLSNLNSMDNFALSYILDLVDPKSVIDGSLADDVRSDVISSSGGFAKSVYGMNRRMQRQFTASVSRQLDSPKFLEQYYGFMSRGASNRKSYISDTSGDYYNQQDEAMRILFGELISAQQNSQKSMNDFNREFYDSRDANLLAGAESSSAERTSSDNLEYKNSNAFRKSVNKKLGDAFENGNLFAGALLGILNELLGLGMKPMNFTPFGLAEGLNAIGSF